MIFNSAQEEFWAHTYAEEYIQRNHKFDHKLGAEAWRTMLRKAEPPIASYLECGCNIGRNIEQLAAVIPGASKSVIEISRPAFEIVTSRFSFVHAFNGPILDSQFEAESFDLVFTVGVLIHINPEQLIANMTKIYRYSSRFVLFGEYFNRTPITIEYRGEQNRLFKRDFGKLFLETFPVELVDYGFFWGHIYDTAGFGDVTWWLFKKR